MSLALIQETAKEVRRLAIAGSPLAVGDFRLKKLAAPLEQAGAKVPVFAQVARAINEVVDGKEADSAANLLNLSTLLNAILYTQGQSGAEGAFGELEIFATACSSTRTPARVLKPLVHALTSAGGGRFEIIKSACERGAFNDLRLIDPAIQAMGDIYPELADLVAEKILPAYGPGIVPRLKAMLDLKGKKPEARKLCLIHQLDPAGTIQLCRTALEDGSTEVKAAAITCLGSHEENLPLVLEQTKAKNKLLRAAALKALAEYDRPEVTGLFCELIKGGALDMLAEPFRAMRNSQVLDALLKEGQRIFDLIYKGDGEVVTRCVEVFDCLRERREPEVEQFLLRNFAQSDKLAKVKPPPPKASPALSFVTGVDLMDRMTWLLFEIGSPAAFEAILAKREVLPPSAFIHVLYSALKVWPPEKVYEEFVSLLGQVKGPGKEKAATLQQVIRSTSGNVASDDEFSPEISVEPESQKPATIVWDRRWLDAVIKADLTPVVCSLARPDHKAAIAYLAKQLETTSKTPAAARARILGESGIVVRTLARCNYPKLTDAFLAAVKARTKSAQHIDYDLTRLLASAKYLPAADLPKLDAFAAKLDEKFVDSFLEALGPLRSTAPNN